MSARRSSLSAMVALAALAAAPAQAEEADAGAAATAPRAVVDGGSAAAEAPPGEDAGATVAAAAAEPVDIRAIEEVDIEALLNAPVVTASGGKAQASALAAADVVTITREEIALHGWRSLAEVLANTPGLYVIDDGVLPAVSVRGVSGGLRAGSRIVKVMINGVAVNFRPDLTAFLGPEFIPMEAVERVEIARGPLSSLYGANAFLATVNVITRDGPDGTQVSLAARTTFLPRFGWSVSGAATHRSQHLNVLMAVSVDELDRSGLAIQRTFDGQDPQVARFRPFFQDQSRGDLATPVSAYLQLEGNWERFGRLTLEGGLQRLDSMGEFQLSSVTTHQTRISLANVWARLLHERNWGDRISTSLSLGFSYGTPTRDERIYLTDNVNSYLVRRFDYRAVDAALKVSITPHDAISIDVGTDFAYEPQLRLFYTQVLNAPIGAIPSGTKIDLIDDATSQTILLYDVGAFVQATWRPLPDLQVTGNFRLDFSNFFAPQYSWRAAAAYRWSPNISSKIIGGRAFQSPSAVQLFGVAGLNANNVLGSQNLIGGAPLTPQNVHSVELVTSANVLGRVALEGSLYLQHVADRIEFVRVAFDFRARNAAAETRVGLELRARGSFGRVSPYLSAGVHPGISSSGLDFQAPASFPVAFGRAGVDVDVPEAYLRANVQVRAASARGASESNVSLNNMVPYALPPYAMVDAAISTNDVQLPGIGETRLQVKVANLLDQRISEPGFGGFDVPQLGRRIMIELRQTF